MVRHGYVSCLACHVSPTGGGVLNEYGRELSRELISTWGVEREAKSLYGILPESEHITIGGDFRWLQLNQSNPNIDRAEFFNMQADIEAAFFAGPITGVITVGRDITRPHEDEGLFSRKHWLMFRLDDNWLVRGGRFFPEYGLRLDHHRRFVRLNFGFDQGQETYNLEASRTDEKWLLFLTAIFGRPDTDEVAEQREEGFALSGSYQLNEDLQLGASYKYGTKDGTDAYQGSFFGLYSVFKDLFLQGEFDFRKTVPADGSATVDSWASFMRLNYEVFQGFNPFLVHELYRPDSSNQDSETASFGFGLQFFPRPHWELFAEYQRRRTPIFSGFDEDLWTVILHFYL